MNQIDAPLPMEHQLIPSAKLENNKHRSDWTPPRQLKIGQIQDRLMAATAKQG